MFFINCTSGTAAIASDDNSGKVKIQFEEVNHYPYSLTSKRFLVIDTQQKMDQVYSVIHQKNGGGGRMAPIPTVSKEETYLVFKPSVKSTNDVTVKEMYLNGKTLYVNVKPFQSPDIAKSSRVSPNVLVKLLGKYNILDVKVNYQ